MNDTPARTPVPLRELQPGKFFESIARPPLARPALPFRVEFGHLHVVDAHATTHLVDTHTHPHYEIILVERGIYRCLINDQEVGAGPGGVILLKPGDRHGDRCRQPMAIMALALRVSPGPNPKSSANLLADELRAEDQVIADGDGLHALAVRMRAEAKHGDPFTAPLLDSLAQEFLWRLLRRMPTAHLSPSLRSGMELHGFGAALMALFETHVNRALHPPEMARAMGLPERSLSTRCRSAFGTAPAKLFQKYRMERARTLLTQTDLSVGAVAECLGFVNQYHFSTVYKRVHGAAPTRHRPA
jgi:AraC-like DNA-binding protein